MSEIALEQEELQSLGAGGSLPNAPDTGTNLIDDTTNRGDAGGALQSVDQQKNALEKFIEPVSYTHLTLPTKRIV